MSKTIRKTVDQYIAEESTYSAHNYHPIPVVIERGEGIYVWDTDGKEYMDFLSAYSAVNQGHCHPKIIQALTNQAQKLTLTSRAFHHNLFAEYAAYMCTLFSYDKILPMNSGAEAVETAIKITRKWGYKHKKVEEDKATIIVCDNNFHGRTTTIVSFSSDAIARDGFGPFGNNGFVSIPYNDIHALESVLKKNKNVVGFLVEPIQGEAGVNVPSKGYLGLAEKLCIDYNVLFIADEIQTGIGRTGKLLATCGNCNCKDICKRTPEIRPDIVILGKAISGGVMPISAVLADDDIMLTIQPGMHGSTFGGSPLACVVSQAAMNVVMEEKLSKNARKMGEVFREGLRQIANNFSIVKTIRGVGLLNAIVMDTHKKDDTLAWDICLYLKEQGLLAKPTHCNKIRLAPPLVITRQEIQKSLAIIKQAIEVFQKK